MSDANKTSYAEPFRVSNIVRFASKQLGIERACRLIDKYVAEMAEQDTKAALTEIKTALQARLPGN